MKSGWMKKSLCLVCLGLPVVLTAVGTGQTAAGPDQSGTTSVLNRVQRVDDPELAELIRKAITNRKDLSEKEAPEIVRKVTQSYAQIKLLDQQIEQVTRKIESTAGPAEMRYELLLAKTELESKRTTELANLREAMGVIPRFPFEKQPIPGLNAWVSLQALDQRVFVLDGLKPFSDYWASARWKVAGLLSEKETLDYIRGRLKDKNSLPIRVDIYFKPETNSACERLRGAIVSLARETNAEMDTEVRLEPTVWVGSGQSTFFLREGKIRTFYPLAVRRPDGGSPSLVSGQVDPNDLEQHILWRLTKPKNVPLTFRIEYDEASAKLAKQVADTAKAVAQRLGIAELVGVEGALVEPAPEAAFAGRWQAVTKGMIQTIDVQPRGACQVTMGGGSEAIQAGATVKGMWLPTTKEIIMDIKDFIIGKNPYVYRASINAEGNLVVYRGVVYPQGSFHNSDAQPTVFKKVQ
jgi:hypothetical protein